MFSAQRLYLLLLAADDMAEDRDLEWVAFLIERLPIMMKDWLLPLIEQDMPRLFRLITADGTSLSQEMFVLRAADLLNKDFHTGKIAGFFCEKRTGPWPTSATVGHITRTVQASVPPPASKPDPIQDLYEALCDLDAVGQRRYVMEIGLVLSLVGDDLFVREPFVQDAPRVVAEIKHYDHFHWDHSPRFALQQLDEIIRSTRGVAMQVATLLKQLITATQRDAAESGLVLPVSPSVKRQWTRRQYVFIWMIGTGRLHVDDLAHLAKDWDRALVEQVIQPACTLPAGLEGVERLVVSVAESEAQARQLAESHNRDFEIGRPGQVIEATTATEPSHVIALDQPVRCHAIFVEGWH